MTMIGDRTPTHTSLAQARASLLAECTVYVPAAIAEQLRQEFPGSRLCPAPDPALVKVVLL